MLFACCFLCLIQRQGIAQENRSAYFIGYFAPFGLNQGGTFGASFELKTINKGHNAIDIKQRSILFTPSIGYFYQPNTAHNYLINPELVYQYAINEKNHFLSGGFGLGYLHTASRVEGKLNLANGKLEYQHSQENYLLPNLNISFGKLPSRVFGYYLKAIYGHKVGIRSANAGFFGINVGLIISLKKSS